MAGYRLVNPEANDGSLGSTVTTMNLNDDANVLGRKLFEEGRVSRNSVISQTQDDLRKKRIPRQISFLECEESSSNKTLKECPVSSNKLSLYGAQTCNPIKTSSVKYDLKQTLELELSRNENTSFMELETKNKCANALQFYEKGNPSELREMILKEKQHAIPESVTQELPSQMDHRKDSLEEGYFDVVNEEIFQDSSHKNDYRKASATEERDCLLRTRNSDLLENAALRDRDRRDSVSLVGWDGFLDNFSSYENSSSECNDENTSLRELETKDECANARQFYEKRNPSELRKMVLEEKQHAIPQSVTQDMPSQMDHRKDSLDGGGYFVVNEEISQVSSQKNGYRNARATEGRDFLLQTRNSYLLENAALRDRDQRDSVSLGGWDGFLDNLSSYENGSSECNDTSKVTEKMREKSRFKQTSETKTHIRDRTKRDLSLHPSDYDAEVDCPTKRGVLQETTILAPKKYISFQGKESKLDSIASKSVTNLCVKDGIKNVRESAQSSETNQKLVSDDDVVDRQVIFSSDSRGAKPKTIIVLTKETEQGSIGVHPEFSGRHSDTSALKPIVLGYQYYNIATRDELQKVWTHDMNSSSTSCSYGEKLNQFAGKKRENSPYCFLHTVVGQQKRFTQQDESWHFPPLPENSEDNVTSIQSQPHLLKGNEENFGQISDQLFDIPECRSTYHDMASLTSEYVGEGVSPANTEESAISKNGLHTIDMDQGTRNPIRPSICSLLKHLKDVMTKNLELWLSSCNEAKHTVPEETPVENVGVQEHSQFQEENEVNESRRDTISNHQTVLLQQSEQSSETIGEGLRKPVQETPRPVCGHYQRRCLVSFPCCGKFYPCHRCHNDSNQCSENQARAINATHIRCSICYHEQEVRSNHLHGILRS